jgi:hypothetical protein
VSTRQGAASVAAALKSSSTFNSQALLEMLENYNRDKTLDEDIVDHGSNPAGARATHNAATPTDKTYNNIITSALSAPENLPIWQAQDSADENSVVDKLNEAINYINDKNPGGAGSLSWSDLDPKVLMALAAWTNQHQNIMPLVEALTVGASSKTPLTTTGLLDAIYKQPYFQGPKAYSSTVWQKRIDDTVQYVNRKEHDNSKILVPPVGSYHPPTGTLCQMDTCPAPQTPLRPLSIRPFKPRPMIGRPPRPQGRSNRQRVTAWLGICRMPTRRFSRSGAECRRAKARRIGAHRRFLTRCH